MIKRSTTSILWAAASCLVLSSAAGATPLVGPVYPAPGGNSYAVGGAPSPGDTGGSDGIYSGFDAAAFSQLYWGLVSAGAGLDGTLHPMAFSSVSGTTAIYTTTTSYTSPGGPNPPSGTYTLELRIDVSGLGATPWVDATTIPGLDPGLATGIGAVIDDSAGLDFTANFQVLALMGGSLGTVALNSVPQLGGSAVSSLSGGFFAAPEPGPAGLLAGGLLVLALARVRARARR